MLIVALQISILNSLMISMPRQRVTLPNGQMDGLQLEIGAQTVEIIVTGSKEILMGMGNP